VPAARRCECRLEIRRGERHGCRMADPHRAPPPSLLDGAALFLDFDGTLVELAEAPDAIAVPGGLHPLLGRLADRLDGRLAIVSGRAIGDLDRHLSLPGIALSGSHGLELRLADGRVSAAASPDGLAAARTAIADFAAAVPGLLVEEKPASIALHYRRVPDMAERVLAFMAALAAAAGLAVQQGKMVAELRPMGATKGDAVRMLMAEPRFAGARPVFVGDDLTDEDAFAAAAGMKGAGVLVGPSRPSAASWRLDDVAAVARWLGEAAEAGHG
jgi:trehalose 6-phosphate phosphatase